MRSEGEWQRQRVVDEQTWNARDNGGPERQHQRAGTVRTGALLPHRGAVQALKVLMSLLT